MESKLWDEYLLFAKSVSLHQLFLSQTALMFIVHLRIDNLTIVYDEISEQTSLYARMTS